MLPHSLSNFEIHKYYQNEPKFNGVYSRNNLTENKGWSMHSLSRWIQVNRNTLDRSQMVRK